MALTRLGHEVVAYTCAPEALADFAARPYRFDLVVTDQTMPGITGRDLAQQVKQWRPDIPIILCTGLSYLVDFDSAQQQGIDAFCMKPLNLQDLAATIERVLPRLAAHVASSDRSIEEDRIICLECGQALILLSHRHLSGHGLTPESYRRQHHLAPDWPLYARSLVRRRRWLAQQWRSS